MDSSLHGKVALVTGGAVRIGRAIVRRLMEEGCRVVVHYHRSAPAARELEEAGCALVRGDLSTRAGCARVVKEARRAFGRLDILVNNAAFQLHAGSLEDVSDERLEETLRTNVGGYLHMARAALPHLKEGSSIINTGSVVGLHGSGELLDYATSKGAIHAFTLSLARSLMPRGIRVNAVAPGPVWTPLNPKDRDAESVARFGQSADMKRAAQPEEISPAYVFLAAPCCASYISGLVLPVTGSVGTA